MLIGNSIKNQHSAQTESATKSRWLEDLMRTPSLQAARLRAAGFLLCFLNLFINVVIAEIRYQFFIDPTYGNNLLDSA